jgi:uncharacterized protein
MNVNNSKMSEEEVREILDACAGKVLKNGKENTQESKKVLLKYFSPQNPKYDVNAPIPNQNGWTPLIFATFFGKNEEVNLLLNLGADPNKKIAKDISALHISSSEGYEEISNNHLQQGAEVNAQTTTGRTPIMGACESGHIKVVKTIMPYKPNITIKDINGRTCIDYAQEKNFVEIASLFEYQNLTRILNGGGGSSGQKRTSKI